MLSYRQLHETATALIDAAGTSPTVNSNIAGKWRSIAEAAEELAGAGTTANNSVAGYMYRTAVALESIAGTDGDEENPGTQGLLKRIVDALEVQAGDVSAGPLGARLRLAAANASFGGSPGPNLWPDPGCDTGDGVTIKTNVTFDGKLRFPGSLDASIARTDLPGSTFVEGQQVAYSIDVDSYSGPSINLAIGGQFVPLGGATGTVSGTVTIAAAPLQSIGITDGNGETVAVFDNIDVHVVG